MPQKRHTVDHARRFVCICLGGAVRVAKSEQQSRSVCGACFVRANSIRIERVRFVTSLGCLRFLKA